MRMTTIAATALFAGCAMAQDFNDQPPRAEGQVPAFEGQTRAPVLPALKLRQEVFAGGLENPWGMAQLPDGRWLVTERPGRLRLIGADGSVSDPIPGLPKADAQDQGGLLDVLVGDDFDQTRRIWVSYAERGADDLTKTAVATGTLAADDGSIEDVQVIWRQSPAYPSTLHYGSRLALDGQGGLFVTTGERGGTEGRYFAQDLTTTLGKVVRIDPLTGQPMGAGIEGAMPEIWSWGHRNMQGAAIAPDGALWTLEHGPAGGDELNRPEAGKNYGWPEATYGQEYSGEPINNGQTQKEGTEQPVYYWDPVIAPGGMVFYQGEMFPEWNGDLLIGGLQAGAMVRLELDGNRVTGEARHLQYIGRVRDVDVAQDGAIMLLLDDTDGAMIRVTSR